jgi:integrase/recombinase XerD
MIRQDKGKKDRVIPLGDRAAHGFHAYVNSARLRLIAEPDDGTEFVSNACEPLSLDYLTEMAATSHPPASASAAPATCSATRWSR